MNQVVQDLLKICPDPGLKINLGVDPTTGLLGDGRVFYTPSMSSVGCNMVASLVNSPCYIAIRGEGDKFGLDPTKSLFLEDRGGDTTPDQYPGTTRIWIIIDEDDCNGYGQWVLDANGKHIAFPTYVCLFHEMSHAFHLSNGTINLLDKEALTIPDENAFRLSLGLPARVGWTGGCNPQPTPPQPPPHSGSTSGGGGNCYVATAAYGSPSVPEIQFLTSLRDEIVPNVRLWDAIYNRYFEKYTDLSPFIISLMEKDDEIRKLVRWLVVSPIVSHLKILHTFPNADIDCEEPWKSFLTQMRDGLEDWASDFELPLDFGGVSPSKAAKEIELVLRYVLRKKESRINYLARLRGLGQIPLRTSSRDRRKIANSLHESGRSSEEIVRIVGKSAFKSAKEESPRHSLAARGPLGTTPDEITLESQLPEDFSFFTVAIRNLTPADTFDEVDVFYNSPLFTGVMFLTQGPLVPGQVAIYVLGPCDMMTSYTVGFFQGNTLVAQIPDPNNPIFGGAANITPALAKQISTNNTDCSNSWSIS